jgi:hypothetical protein
MVSHSHKIKVIGQLHVPAVLPLGYEFPVIIGKEAGWAPEAGRDATAKRKNILSLPLP